MIGSTLSHYRITAELGRGGMGIVYRATDTKLNREVALKILPAAALASDEDRARFFREAQAAAQLHHPNIATVFEIDEAVPEGGDEAEPRPFIAMEFIDGEPLADRIKTAPLKISEAIRIATEMARALEVAHDKKIVHRDIKAANVMLTTKNEAKVLDFGLAKTTHSTMLTRMGSTLGTIAYMSPEQARGEEVDHRTDLWALGVTLYEMVSGKHPFAGDYEQAVVYGILNEEPEPLTGLRTGVPMEMERIVNKLLAKDADLRYQSASGLIADLKGIVLSLSTSSRSSPRITPQEQPPPALQPTHRPSYAMMAAIALVAVLTGLAIGLWGLGGESTDTRTVTRQVSVNFEGLSNITDPQTSPDGKYLVFSASDSMGIMKAVVYDFQEGEIAHEFEISGFLSVDFSPDGRWVAMSAIGRNVITFLLPDGNPQLINLPIEWAAWDTNESLIYRWEGKLYRVLVTGGDGTLFAEPDSTRGHDRLWPSYVFPGGDHALISAGGVGNTQRDLAYMDLRNGEYRVLVQNAHSGYYVDSGHLAYLQGGGLTGQIVVQPYDARRHEVFGIPVRLDIPAISWRKWSVGDDGSLTHTSAGFRSGNVFWMNASGQVSEFRLTDASARQISLSPDGKSVAVTSGDESRESLTSQIINIEGNRVPFKIPGLVQDVAPVWTTSGDHVYYFNTGQSGTSSTIFRFSGDGSGNLEIIGRQENRRISKLDVSDDEKLIYFSEDITGDLFIYDVESGTGEPLWVTDNLLEEAPDLSPSGRYLAFEERNRIRGTSRRVVVRDLESDRSWEFGDPNTPRGRPQWSRGGNYLYFSDASGHISRIHVQSSDEFTVLGNIEIVGSTTGYIPSFSLASDNSGLAFISTSDFDANESVQLILGFPEEAQRIAPRE